ncbi:hypothetical protein V8B97DRAFT_2005937 [Scleroderma yunnanense]
MVGPPRMSAKAARKQYASEANNQVNMRPKTTSAKTSKKVAFHIPSSDEGETPDKSHPNRARPQARANVVPRRVDKGPGDSLENRLSRSTHHFYVRSAECAVWSNRHSRKEFIQDGTPRKSVSRITAGRSRPGQVPSDHIDNRQRFTRPSKIHLVDGRFVSPEENISSENDSSSEPECPIEDKSGPPKDGRFKAARKFQVGVKSTKPLSANPIHEDETHDVEEHHSTIYDDSVHDSAAYDEADNDASESTAPRPPFLLRNLRVGFKSRCTLIGIDPHKKEPPLRPVSITYPRHLGRTEEKKRAINSVIEKQVHSWMCPLCDWHGAFNNRTAFDMHLRWDHPEVKATWNATFSTLSLVIPVAEETLAAPVKVEPLSILGVGQTSRSQVVEKSVDRASSTPSATLSGPSRTTTATPVAEDATPKMAPPLEKRMIPRAVDDFGPSAAFPYLPKSADGSMYSCRPGGPRLYDMLNTLPLEPFGVLSWTIIDREEELFELDDVLDEDKVILALWNRWITLNRNKFVANYFDGTKAFVKEYRKMIHQAAGLSALRTWLLVLCVNNFLSPLEVVSIIRFYQALESKNPV